MAEANEAPAWVASKAALDALNDGSSPYVMSWAHPGEEGYWEDFKAWAVDHLGQGFSLAVLEGMILDKITESCFQGYRVGRKHSTMPPRVR